MQWCLDVFQKLLPALNRFDRQVLLRNIVHLTHPHSTNPSKNKHTYIHTRTNLQF